MKYRIYSPEGIDQGIVEAAHADAALLAFVKAEGYQVGDLQREAACEERRGQIATAKAVFAAAHGLSDATNSAITKAWKRAGKPGV